MSTHSIHPEKESFYFCTVTCYKWIELFKIADFYDEIYSWFDILFDNKCLIPGYVLMPNHFHFIIYQFNEAPLLDKLLANGKRFMAYNIVDRLKNNGELKLLDFLNSSVPLNEIKKGKKHQVFIPSFDARLCDSIEMVEQKLDYIHNNPVQGKWNLAPTFVDYPHSSAQWYELGIPINYRWFRDYREIVDL
jgi:hypothetical protein